MKIKSLPSIVSVWQIDKFVVVLCGAFFLPFLFHLIPQSSLQPLGSLWLPIFYAPLVAVILYRRHVALLAAVVAPSLNSLLLGMPAWPMARVLTVELILFVGIAWGIQKIHKRFWGLGAAAYVLAKIFSVIWLKGLDFSVIFNSLMNAKQGLVMLLIIGFITVKGKRKTEHDENIF